MAIERKSRMSDAKTLFSEIKKEMADLEDRIRNHPFIAAVEAGEAPREALTIFSGEQYHIIESDLRSVAQVLSRHPVPLTHAFFWGTPHGSTCPRSPGSTGSISKRSR
jgi:hypothetical protein